MRPKHIGLFTCVSVLVLLSTLCIVDAWSAEDNAKGLNKDSDLKGDIMKKQTASTSRTERSARPSKFPEWSRNLLVGVIGGLVVLAGQIFVNPVVARRVRIEESITQKRYEACEKAVELLQRRLASVAITGKPIPEWYTPPEKTPPTQVEMNIAYTLLVIYSKSRTIADEFFAATGPGKTDPADIVKFISAVRKELGVDKEDFTGEFHYRLLRPVGENGQENEKPEDEQTQ